MREALALRLDLVESRVQVKTREPDRCSMFGRAEGKTDKTDSFPVTVRIISISSSRKSKSLFEICKNWIRNRRQLAVCLMKAYSARADSYLSIIKASIKGLLNYAWRQPIDLWVNKKLFTEQTEGGSGN